MKKWIWTFVILVVVGVFSGRAWWLYEHRETEKNVVKVGVLSFPSGQYAKMGQELNNGIILAVEEINASSDYKGKKIKLIMEDGKGVAKEAVNAFHKLKFNQIDALIATGDNQVPPVAPLIIQNKIPTILTIMGNSEFAKSNTPKFMYQNYFSVLKGGEKLGEYLISAFWKKNFSVLVMNVPYSLECFEGFRNIYTQQGGVITTVEKFREHETDTRSLVEKIIAQKPDGILVVGYGQAYISLLNRLKEVRYNGLLVTDQGITNPKTVENIKDIKDFIFFAQSTQMGRNEQVERAYQNRFNEKMSNFAMDGYSSVMILGEAIKNSDGSSEGINIALSKIKKIDTIRGNLILDEQGMGSLPIFIGRMKADGTYDILEERE